MNFFIENIYTIILFPLWIFLLIILGRFFNVVQSRRVITILTLLSTLYGIIFSIGCFLYLYQGPDFVYEASYNFIKIDDYCLKLGVLVDNLSSIMLIVVTIISFAVQFYSSGYMFKDKSFTRFFAYLNLFNFSMLGLILSPNLFQNYIFWELVGLSSYLLIGFWYKKPSASYASKKAFVMNRIGDFGLLSGTIAISYFMYEYSSVTSLATVPFVNISDIGNYLYSYTNDAIFIIICVLLLLGSFAKSAQFPLHTWLADAMEGPTPVSALIHSATMVAAGVYLIARLYPIYSLSTEIMYFIAIIGLFTALICAYFAITQTDFKRILAYSTNSQLGLMFLALGAGAYTGGLYHLVIHAYIKSMLFLCSGIVIHSLLNQKDIRFMGGLRKYLPITAFCYLIGCISISGLFFSGFYSKESILKSMLENNHYIFSIGFLIVGLMTAFYMFRTYFLIFEGNYKGEKPPLASSFILNASILFLVIPVISLGFLSHNWIGKFIYFGNSISQSAKTIDPVFISICVALIGFSFAFLFYNTKVRAIKIPILYELSKNKLYIDDLYGFLSDKVYRFISKLTVFTDKYVIDGFVKLSVLITRMFSWIFSKMQTGNFQSYLSYAVIFLGVFFTGLMFAYILIINYNLLSAGGN